MSELNSEILFSFEFLVEHIKLRRDRKASGGLALAVRLLDFPTLLISQPARARRPARRDEDGLLEYVFYRGKSCFFKMSLRSLRASLTHNPLHAIVLDVTEETPLLIGSCLVSLAKAVSRIWQDVTKHGTYAPSTSREREVVDICDLSGENIGTTSLSYKLVCLGASLLPLITQRSVCEPTSQVCVEKTSEAPEASTEEHLPAEEKLDVRTHTREAEFSNISVKERYNTGAEDESENHLEDLRIFCPPHLYYSNTANENSRHEEEDNLGHHLDLNSFCLDDLSSEIEEDKRQVEGQAHKGEHRKVTGASKPSSRHDPRSGTQNILREALGQMPVLNALVGELSLLYGESFSHSVPAFPSQMLISRHTHTEPSSEPKDTPHQTARQAASTNLSILQPPTNGCTVAADAALKNKHNSEDTVREHKSSCKSQKRKLKYGTTKTFNLRLKQISPFKGNQRECVELKNQALLKKDRGKLKSAENMIKRNKPKILSPRPGVDENTEMGIQSVKQDSSDVKRDDQYEQSYDGKEMDTQGALRKSSDSLTRIKSIQIQVINGDSVPQSNDKSKHHNKSDQSESEFVQETEKAESLKSSRLGSLSSDVNIYENEEMDYPDDFDSLGSNEAFSPDPVASPELSGVRTPNVPAPTDADSSDHTSEDVRRRSVPLPVPVKAPSSPHRALMGTHIIRPRTQNSALSFSSDENDEIHSASSSSQIVLSRKRMPARNQHELSGNPESSLSCGGDKPNKDKRNIEKRHPESSLSAEEVEDVEDEVGSLNFRNEYQHISKLVATKLPGYTM